MAVYCKALRNILRFEDNFFVDSTTFLFYDTKIVIHIPFLPSRVRVCPWGGWQRCRWQSLRVNFSFLLPGQIKNKLEYLLKFKWSIPADNCILQLIKIHNTTAWCNCTIQLLQQTPEEEEERAHQMLVDFL